MEKDFIKVLNEESIIESTLENLKGNKSNTSPIPCPPFCHDNCKCDKDGTLILEPCPCDTPEKFTLDPVE